MNNITKEIANILEAQIDNRPYEIQASGLTNEQLEEINKFASKYNRSGFGFYPLKGR
jgi:hypothetical protein